MNSWPDIKQARKNWRSRFIDERLSLSRKDRLLAQEIIIEKFHEYFTALRDAVIGFYWPIKGEINLRHLFLGLVESGATGALPVVVKRDSPVEFWAWTPSTPLKRGFWNIPVPAREAPVQPTVLLVPLVAFDHAGYRLGYGGGYYDRTLAQMASKPLTIGIGYDFSEIETIYPQNHDIPMDVIMTEKRVGWRPEVDALISKNVSALSIPAWSKKHEKRHLL